MNLSTIECEDLLIEMGLMNPPNKLKDKYTCKNDDCDGKLIADDGFAYCDMCGAVDSDHVVQEYLEYNTMGYYKKTNYYYKRRQYCIEKLMLLAGQKVSRSKQYNEMISVLEKKKFTNIHELKKIMKKYNYSKFYKYVYSVFYDLKKTRLINLTDQQIKSICQEFIDMESKFKNIDDKKRKNIYAYNSIIYYIMKKNNIQGYDNVIVPHNNNFIIKQLKSLDAS